MTHPPQSTPVGPCSGENPRRQLAFTNTPHMYRSDTIDYAKQWSHCKFGSTAHCLSALQHEAARATADRPQPYHPPKPRRSSFGSGPERCTGFGRRFFQTFGRKVWMPTRTPDPDLRPRGRPPPGPLRPSGTRLRPEVRLERTRREEETRLNLFLTPANIPHSSAS